MKDDAKSKDNAPKPKVIKLPKTAGFIKNMGTKFLEISPENRMRCKLILFPAGFYVGANKIVYTPEISPLSHLVRQVEVGGTTLRQVYG